MKKFFKYDYNNRMLIITNLVSAIFLFFSCVAYSRNFFVVCWLLGAAFFLSLLNSWIIIKNQGIHIKEDMIVIVEDFHFTKLRFDEIKHIKIIKLKKQKRSNLYGFFHEFYHHNTYMWHCDYTYNHGEVFKIVFYLKNGYIQKETYFGWMYKEKRQSKVQEVQMKLEKFVQQINDICSQTQRA